jgi:hypothetical protein
LSGQLSRTTSIDEESDEESDDDSETTDEEHLQELAEMVHVQSSKIAEKDAFIAKLQTDKDDELRDALLDKDKEFERRLGEKDQELAKKNLQINRLKTELEEKEEEIAELRRQLSAGATHGNSEGAGMTPKHRGDSVNFPVFQFPTTPLRISSSALGSPGAASVLSNTEAFSPCSNSTLLSRAPPRAVASMKDALRALDKVENSLLSLARQSPKRESPKRVRDSR